MTAPQIAADTQALDRSAIVDEGREWGHTPGPIPENDDADGAFAALPERLLGRADWLASRGRIKDAELMYAAAAEIRESRQMRAAIAKATGAQS